MKRNIKSKPVKSKKTDTHTFIEGKNADELRNPRKRMVSMELEKFSYKGLFKRKGKGWLDLILNIADLALSISSNELVESFLLGVFEISSDDLQDLGLFLWWLRYVITLLRAFLSKSSKRLRHIKL